MKSSPLNLEVEIRFHFADRDEAFRTLPFLPSCLDRGLIWLTHLHGPALFGRGELLRITSGHMPGGDDRFLLGWKGPDRGDFANIREEVDEEITGGIADSAILPMLGGGPAAVSPAEIDRELARLGHPRFGSFAGHSLLGVHEPLGLQLKLMYCQALRWPLLLEIEKSAGTWKQARAEEKVLLAFTEAYGLRERMVRDEPPTLLLETLG